MIGRAMGRLSLLTLVRKGALCTALLGCLWAPPARAEEPPVIAAAADLHYALADVAQLFTRETGRRVKLSFGSSGNFARQVRQGAPFQVFLSADEGYALGLAKDGLTEGQGALYAVGRIALFVPRGSPIKADAELRDLAAAAADGRLKRLAIANPEHAPYGRAAQEALIHGGFWDRVKDKLALGENISQTAQFALSGSAQAGIIAYSLALSPQMKGRGAYALIPQDWYAPLNQRMVLLKGAGQTARAFYAFMQKPEAREILKRYGFALPGP